MLPESVLEKAQAELMNYRGSGMSVMEMSHRSAVYADIFAETKARFQAALSVLFETEQEGGWLGHSTNYCTVLSGGEALRGLVKNVEITGVSGGMLVGTLVDA